MDKTLKGEQIRAEIKTAKVVSLHDYYLMHPERKRGNSLLNNYGDKSGVVFTSTQVSFVHVDSIETPSGLNFSDPVQISTYLDIMHSDHNRTRVFWLDKLKSFFR